MVKKIQNQQTPKCGFSQYMKHAQLLPWLLFSTHLKNISKIGSFPQIGMIKKEIETTSQYHIQHQTFWQVRFMGVKVWQVGQMKTNTLENYNSQSPQKYRFGSPVCIVQFHSGHQIYSWLENPQ